MNRNFKALTSLTVLACLSLAATCSAAATESSGASRTKLQIDACVAEISRRADYSGASRVVHFIEKLAQKNLAELEITAVTSVYTGDRGRPVREYTAVCITGTDGEIVSFRLGAID